MLFTKSSKINIGNFQSIFFVFVADVFFVKLLCLHREIEKENSSFKSILTEVVSQRCSVKKVFLEISNNPQESTYARASLLITGVFL